MGQNELKAGQTIYLKPIGNAARREKAIIETKVSKVGNKYHDGEQKKHPKYPPVCL